jgi:hypothetical protein
MFWNELKKLKEGKLGNIETQRVANPSQVSVNSITISKMVKIGIIVAVIAVVAYFAWKKFK